MPWLLTFHIAALLCWCGALLYLPAMLLASRDNARHFDSAPGGREHIRMPRFVYTHVATPAALCAIITGTLVFLAYDIVDLWLGAKLLLVAFLVTGHLLAGLLVVRAEQHGGSLVISGCYALTVFLAVVMAAIAWLVLAKPWQGL